MNIVFSDEQDDPLETGALSALARSVLVAEGLPGRTEVTIGFVTAEAMAIHNARYLNREGATDVLSLPIEDPALGSWATVPVDGPPLILGDVLICPAVVRDNASRHGVPFGDEMALMVTHGLLHLLGYDHEADDDAVQMEARERELLSLVGRVRP